MSVVYLRKRSDFETDTTVAERLILPILEEMYEEPFQVAKSSVKQDPFPHLQLSFTSAVRFTLDYGIVAAAGGGLSMREMPMRCFRFTMA